jgi:hypothetical protein
MKAILRSLLICLLCGGNAVAHHSFAVFFDEKATLQLDGVVTAFQFRNPHGLIRMSVTSADGQSLEWKAETNSPSILERRGWKSDSLKVGDKIRVDGWRARDGARYLRMRAVWRSDGTPVGVPLESVGEQK